MQVPTDLLPAVITSSVLTSALCGLISFGIQTYINHRFAHKLERLKAEHTMQLENYRTTLIAQAEQAKSAAAVKQASALMIVEMKFKAIADLYTLLSTADVEFAAIASATNKTKKLEDKAEKLCLDIEAAIQRAAPFLTKDEQEAMDICWNHVHLTFKDHCKVSSEPMELVNSARLFDSFLEALRLMTAKLLAMADL